MCTTGRGSMRTSPAAYLDTPGCSPRPLAARRMPAISSARMSVTSQADSLRSLRCGTASPPPSSTTAPDGARTRSPAGAYRGEAIAPTPRRRRRTGGRSAPPGAGSGTSAPVLRVLPVATRASCNVAASCVGPCSARSWPPARAVGVTTGVRPPSGSRGTPLPSPGLAAGMTLAAAMAERVGRHQRWPGVGRSASTPMTRWPATTSRSCCGRLRASPRRTASGRRRPPARCTR